MEPVSVQDVLACIMEVFFLRHYWGAIKHTSVRDTRGNTRATLPNRRTINASSNTTGAHELRRGYAESGTQYWLAASLNS